MTQNSTVLDQTAQARAALDSVRRMHPMARLLAGHRDAIRVALAQSGLPADGEVHQRVEQVLASARTYEETGMFAFVPTWADLFARLDARQATADGALVS